MKPMDGREEILLPEAVRRAAGPEREAFLNQACAGEPALRARLEALLRDHENPEALPQPQPAQPATRTVPVPPEEAPRTIIGHYKPREKIGEGGWGVLIGATSRHSLMVALWRLFKLYRDWDGARAFLAAKDNGR